MKLQEITNSRAYEYKYLYKRMFPYMKPYLFRGILGILIAIPVGALDGVVAFALKPYMDEVIVKKNQYLAVIIPFAIVFFAIVQGFLKYLNTYLNDWTGKRITNDLKNYLFKRLVAFESSFYDKNSSGLIIARFLSDADGASSNLINEFKTFISTICSSISLVGVLLYNSWQLALVAIAVLVCSILPMKFLRQRIKYVSEGSMRLGGRVLTHFSETVNGNKIVASYNKQNKQAETFKQQVNESFNLTMKLTKSVSWLSPIMYLIASVGVAIVMWYGNHLIVTNQITSGTFFSFVTALLLLYKPIKTIGPTLVSMQGSCIAISRVVDLFDYEPSIKNKEDAIKIDTVKDSIRLEDVWFEYEQGTPVLKNINLDVKIGESLALVGNSGGGKSTIANLIPRFYDVTSGVIKIDGIDVRNIELESLRNNISVVFQDNFLFSGSIKDNILIGNPDATDEQISKALKDSYLNEFVSELEEGIYTQVGERGTRLSGGQKQRVAIARAMIKAAPIVILDEATSALDNKSEAIVQKALDKLMENKTVIVIAHRLSTIKNADKIAVINEGQVVELGSHDELIAIENGAYKTLYDSQFRNKEQEIVAG